MSSLARGFRRASCRIYDTSQEARAFLKRHFIMRDLPVQPVVTNFKLSHTGYVTLQCHNGHIRVSKARGPRRLIAWQLPWNVLASPQVAG